MSYTLKSFRAVGDGYYRFSFTPCSKEFIVDIPQSRLEEVFAELSGLDLNKPFTIDIRRRQEFGNPCGNKDSYELRFNYHPDWITGVIPVNQDIILVNQKDSE